MLSPTQKNFRVRLCNIWSPLTTAREMVFIHITHEQLHTV